MKAYDFEYDGVRLSDKGMVICKFDSGGAETISNGSEITLNTISTLGGSKYEHTSSQYEDCLTATFQICNNPCSFGDIKEFSVEDVRDIMRWLNRKGFHKFKLLDVEYSGIYFESSFNVSKIEINGAVFGFELEMLTNRPFALHEPVEIVFDSDENNKLYSFYSQSDEEGFIYPDMEISIKSDGDLNINSITEEDRIMNIKNCKNGEIITINYPIILSSLGEERSTKIQNDFNWIFYRVATSFKNKKNEFSVSLPCSIKLKYSPIVKIGI